MQKFLMLMNTDDAPIANASRFVMDVMLIATPVFFSMCFILSSTDATDNDGASAIPDIKINMSSMPIPRICY
jgi:hypothetical protein